MHCQISIDIMWDFPYIYPKKPPPEEDNKSHTTAIHVTGDIRTNHNTHTPQEYPTLKPYQSNSRP